MTPPRPEDVAARIAARWFVRRADRSGTVPPDPDREPGRAACWERQMIDDVTLVLTALLEVLLDDEMLDRIGDGDPVPDPDWITRRLVAWRAEARDGTDPRRKDHPA